MLTRWFLLLLLSIPSLVEAQSYFEKYYGSLYPDQGRTLEIIDDSIIAISGNTLINGGTTTDAFLLLIDHEGNVRSNQTFNSNFRNSINDLQWSNTGTLFMAGNIAPASRRDDWVILGVSPAGNLISETYYGNFDLDEELHDFKIGSDGNLILCGTDGVSRHGYIAKMSPNGDPLWKKRFDINDDLEFFHSIIETSRQTYLAVGYATLPNKTEVALATMVDQNGNLIWSHLYDDNLKQATGSLQVIETADGGFLLVSPTTADQEDIDIALIKLNRSGNLIWSKTYGGNKEDRCQSIIKANDGNYLLAGHSNSFSADQNGFLMKIDPQGEVIYSESYGGQGDDYFIEVEEYTHQGNSSYYLLGYSNSLSSAQSDIYLVKVNEEGSTEGTLCHSSSISFDVGNNTFNRTSSGSLEDWLAVTNHSFTIASSPFSSEDKECTMIDLDDNNSSGATGDNFQLPPRCYSVPLSIADVDTKITTNGTIDSLQVIIASGAGNGADEFLTFSGNTPLQLVGSGSQRITFINISNADADVFEEAVKGILYHNTANSITQGRRVIDVVAFNGRQASNIANTFIILLDNSPLAIDLGPDTSICPNSLLVLDATHAQATSYFWQNGSSSPMFTVTEAGTYIVWLSSQCRNFSDTIVVTEDELTLSIELGRDTTLCNGNSLLLDATHADAIDYLWQDGSTAASLTAVQTGAYIVEVSSKCQTLKDTINITNLELSLDLGDDFIAICEDTPFSLNAYHPDISTYLWQDGSTADTLAITESGNYRVEVSNFCGTLEDSVMIIVDSGLPAVELGGHQFLCLGDTIVLDATADNGIWYSWQDSTSHPVFNVTDAGIYQVKVENGCGSATDYAEIGLEDCCQFYIPNTFSPNSDGLNDVFKVFPSMRGCNSLTFFSMQIFDRWGGMIYATDNVGAGWDGLDQSGNWSNGVYVYLIRYHDGIQEHLKTGDVMVLK